MYKSLGKELKQLTLVVVHGRKHQRLLQRYAGLRRVGQGVCVKLQRDKRLVDSGWDLKALSVVYKGDRGCFITLNNRQSVSERGRLLLLLLLEFIIVIVIIIITIIVLFLPSGPDPSAASCEADGVDGVSNVSDCGANTAPLASTMENWNEEMATVFVIVTERVPSPVLMVAEKSRETWACRSGRAPRKKERERERERERGTPPKNEKKKQIREGDGLPSNEHRFCDTPPPRALPRLGRRQEEKEEEEGKEEEKEKKKEEEEKE